MPRKLIPLRVQFDLLTPMVPAPMGLHLDGLIAFAVVEQALAEGTFVDHETCLANLPLGREERDGEWCWQASQIAPMCQSGLDMRFMTRRFWSEGFAEEYAAKRIELGLPRPRGSPPLEDPTRGNPGTIDVARNHMKNASFTYPAALVPTAIAFCVGDAEHIESLLKAHVTHLGKRGRLDHGRIRNISLVEDAMALELWWQRDLPWARAGHYEAEGRVRPPYWSRTGMQRMYSPTVFNSVAV